MNNYIFIIYLFFVFIHNCSPYGVFFIELRTNKKPFKLQRTISDCNFNDTITNFHFLEINISKTKMST